VLFDFDPVRLSAVAVEVAVAASVAAVRWNGRPAVGGEPEAGNMASMLDLIVCGEFTTIGEGIPPKMIV
jgi:hypothetical protein